MIRTHGDLTDTLAMIGGRVSELEDYLRRGGGLNGEDAYALELAARIQSVVKIARGDEDIRR